VKKRGFTLVELIVTILIIGILASVAIPQYQKAVETGKANNAVAILKTVAASHHLFALAHNSYLTTSFFSWGGGCATGLSCPDGVCPNCTVCSLLSCKYVDAQGWNSTTTYPYSVWTISDASINGTQCNATGTALASANAMVAMVCRANSASATYRGWGYAIDVNGLVFNFGGAPAAP
jgi:prepilin-type N-terminal cleavage/methylation domain-containing protein